LASIRPVKSTKSVTSRSTGWLTATASGSAGAISPCFWAQPPIAATAAAPKHTQPTMPRSLIFRRMVPKTAPPTIAPSLQYRQNLPSVNGSCSHSADLRSQFAETALHQCVLFARSPTSYLRIAGRPSSAKRPTTARRPCGHPDSYAARFSIKSRTPFHPTGARHEKAADN
jgi:hypothetical protein